jgi:hypothetical protein
MVKATFEILNYCLLDIDWESVRKSVTFAEQRIGALREQQINFCPALALTDICLECLMFVILGQFLKV